MQCAQRDQRRQTQQRRQPEHRARGSPGAADAHQHRADRAADRREACVAAKSFGDFRLVHDAERQCRQRRVQHAAGEPKHRQRQQDRPERGRGRQQDRACRDSGQGGGGGGDLAVDGIHDRAFAGKACVRIAEADPTPNASPSSAWVQLLRVK